MPVVFNALWKIEVTMLERCHRIGLQNFDSLYYAGQSLSPQSYGNTGAASPSTSLQRSPHLACLVERVTPSELVETSYANSSFSTHIKARAYVDPSLSLGGLYTSFFLLSTTIAILTGEPSKSHGTNPGPWMSCQKSRTRKIVNS